MSELETVRPPRINGALVAILQTAIDDRAVVAIAQPRSKGIMCSSKERRGDTLVGCSALAAFHHLDEEECGECGKLKKHADEPYCLAHVALHLDGRLQSPQTSLMEVDPATHAAPAQRNHDEEVDEDDEPPQAEDVGVTLSGTTGAPIGNAYAVTPSPDDASVCVCGFPVSGGAGDHNVAHAAYIEATESLPPAKKRGSRSKVIPIGSAKKKSSSLPGARRKKPGARA